MPPAAGEGRAEEDFEPLVARPGPLWSLSPPSGGALASAAGLSRGRAAGWLASRAARAAPRRAAAPPPLLSAANAPLLALLAVYSFFGSCLLSVASPFLPTELARVGASQALVGAVFAAYPLLNLALSPLCPAVVRRLGRRGTLLFGIVLESASAAAMGAVPVRRGAGGAYLVLRCLQGAGSALSYTALLAFCAERFAAQLATVIGIQEAISGVGFMVGPVIGGALFAVGGFAAPFVALGVGLLAALPLLPFALPRRSASGGASAALEVVPPGGNGNGGSDAAAPVAERPPPLSFREVLRVPAVLDAAGVTLLAGVAFGFVGPTLAPHLATSLRASEAAIGALFGLCAAAYAAAAPAAGALADRAGAERTMRAGVALLAAAYLLLGPSPAMGAAPRPGGAAAWAAQSGALLLLGAGAAGAIIPCLPHMEREAARVGGGGSGAEGAAALFNAVYCAGEAAGPLVGGALVSGLGFRGATSAVAALLALYLAAAAAAAPARRDALRAALRRCGERTREAAAAARHRLRARGGQGEAPLSAPLLFEEDDFGDEPQPIAL